VQRDRKKPQRARWSRSSQSGAARASSSRKATTSPPARRSPVFRAPDSPGRPLLGMIVTSSKAAASRRASGGQWSTATIVSAAGLVWPRTDASAAASRWKRSSV
jgi:hypothetical protein